MLDLRFITDADVTDKVEKAFAGCEIGSDAWRVLGAAHALSSVHSFSGTRTYPRPDHPDPRKRLPLEYLLVGIIVSLRTTLENEQLAMSRLIERFPRVNDLKSASPESIADAIAPAGLADSKSTRIVEALAIAGRIPGGLASLRELSPSDARSFLLDLPGFGPKAADCFMTIGLGYPSMVVDVNVFRFSVSLLGLSWTGPASYSNQKQVKEVKTALDLIVGNDAFLCQIVHTLFLLEGKRRRGTHPANCSVEIFCRTCEFDPQLQLL